MKTGADPQLWQRYERYCQEVGSIEAKIQGGRLPRGKREKLTFRLDDIKGRLIPDLLRKMQRS